MTDKFGTEIHVGDTILTTALRKGTVIELKPTLNWVIIAEDADSGMVRDAGHVMVLPNQTPMKWEHYTEERRFGTVNKVRCPKCGDSHIFHENLNFCSQCGQMLES